MAEYFKRDGNRFASFGIVKTLPSEVIDCIWLMIDRNINGFLPLESLLTFSLINNAGELAIYYASEQEKMALSVDFPLIFNSGWPTEIYAYDNGSQETILLPAELPAGVKK